MSKMNSLQKEATTALMKRKETTWCKHLLMGRNIVEGETP